MKQYFKKLALFLAIFFGLYLGFFYCVDEGLKKSDYLDFQSWNDIYEGNIDADLIIQGSSRAWRQVDPRIVDSVLGVNSYNLGVDGYQLPMQITRNKIYRQWNEKPKYIVQVLDHFSLTRRKDLFNRDQFLPYVHDTLLEAELMDYKGLGRADYVVPYLQYVGSQEVAIAGLLEFLGIKDFAPGLYKGFQSQDKTWEPDFDAEKAENPEGKTIGLSWKVYEEFDAFLGEAKKEGIEVVLVYSPEFYEFQDYIQNRAAVSQLYKGLADRHGFTYLDYGTSPICRDKELFYNPTHLNKKGAALFSAQLSLDLKQVLH